MACQFGILLIYTVIVSSCKESMKGIAAQQYGMYASILVALISYLVPNYSKDWKDSKIFLGTHTISLSYLGGFVAIKYSAAWVMVCLAITLAIIILMAFLAAKIIENIKGRQYMKAVMKSSIVLGVFFVFALLAAVLMKGVT